MCFCTINKALINVKKFHFKDYAKGFGGKYGVTENQKDKAAVGFDHVEKLAKHSSQTGKQTIRKDSLKN